ncbi:hypothetical protein CY34DRAFT_798258 [Suillus luteus UH-Slu-Lm8-n1]|uniref:DUF6534 domain-containing protein n=1 Tax=Suillus luteus UH-Slu-Lm8-n1 TaxID=930992 RepID=A0A0D0B352_9AGAM|nr:hypothetical protein CY34DRAFT_798258 [Suillus luteus UH-Slu-Lm8-n1]
MSGVAQDYGAILLGGLLAFGLSGCVNMQFIVYWQLYSYESWRVKSLVVAITLLDWCHSAFVAIALWDSIIVPYGNMDDFDKIPWSVGPAVELTAMITFLVQCIFAYRIYRLQKKRLTVVVPIVALAFFRLVAASVSMSEMIRLQSYAAFIQQNFSRWIFTVGLSLSAFVDIMITAIMCYFLRKNRTMVISTIRIIDTLTLWTIRNGSMTSAAAIASLICWLAMPDNRTFLGLHFVIAKLYANSLLATLNARQHIRNGKQHNSSSDRPLPIIFSEDWENAPEALRPQHGFAMRLDSYIPRGENTKRGQTIQVNVERVVESKLDDDALEPTESCTERSIV